MRFLLLTVALRCAGVLVPTLLSATSIIPFVHLGEATAYSECVVLARAVAHTETDENGTIFRDTKFESIESVKGQLAAGTEFVLRPLSCRSGDYSIDIAGDFAPETGKTYLLFLRQKGDFWRPILLSYYVFEQFQIDADQFLVSTGTNDVALVARPDGQLAEPLGAYQQGAFLQHLRAYAASPNMVWDGSIGRSLLRREDFEAADRTIPGDCDFALGSNIARWQDAAIPVYYDDTAIPANWATRFTNFLAAMNSNYGGISPSDAGSVDYDPNCTNNSAYQGNFTSFCDANLGGPQCALIIFDDPCNEVGDPACSGGVLAIGGCYTSSSTHQFDGLTWRNALYGFVVVNNGTPPPDCLSNLGFERMMAHELTHAYSMDHLPAGYEDQNMFGTCCNPIGQDDRDCINYAYPPPAPVELGSFEARRHGERQVKLKWATHSEKDNAHFTIQRSPNGTQYEPLQQVPSKGNNTGGTYEWVDTRPLAGLNYYLLSQTDFDGKVQHLGIKAVSVGGAGNGLNIVPNPVAGQTLFFSAGFPDAFDGTLEVLAADGRVVLSAPLALEKGAQQMQQPLGDIPAGVYLLRLYGGQEQWATRFLKK
ncbi:MAG: T9SS type A sorting domain-containing protein [Saprospiraceae bacterium]